MAALCCGANAQSPAPRILTLAPHATEMVYAAGAGQFLVGTVTSSDYPAEAREITRIGDGIVLNQERIIMLQPSLMIGWLRSGVALQVESLAEQLQAQMYYARPLRLRDIPPRFATSANSSAQKRRRKRRQTPWTTESMHSKPNTRTNLR